MSLICASADRLGLIQIAGLTGCTLHGLRKACCRRMAEAGCTGPEIMAVSGHKSLTEVERYIRDAEQRRMAERAIARTKTYPRDDQCYPWEKKHERPVA